MGNAVFRCFRAIYVFFSQEDGERGWIQADIEEYPWAYKCLHLKQWDYLHILLCTYKIFWILTNI